MSESEKLHFYLIQHVFESPDKDWANEYLLKRENRITYLVRHQLGNEYWEKYSKELVECVEKKEVLFRAKLVKDSTVQFVQIWKDEKVARKFDLSVNSGLSPIDVLKELGFKITQSASNVTILEGQNLVEFVLDKQAIIQFIHDPFFVPKSTPIGDPLKSGKGHLPYP